MKTLRTAALIVGAVALAATGVGALASVGLTLGLSAATLATIATVATVASFAAGALSLAAIATAPKGTLGGNATKFKIDKDAGIPIVFGRTYAGGNVVHRQFYGPKNVYESWVTVLSLGPVKSIGPLLIDKSPVSFSGGNAVGNYHDFMWLTSQLGACPEPAALAGPVGAFPGWYPSSKLSGLAADLWTLKFDTKGKKYPNGVPQRGRIVEGVFAWDPRLDSTYPGGVGPCRRDDPSTYIWTECPWLLCLNHGLGAVQNGHLMAGGGLRVTGVDVNAFVQAANYSDLVGWKAGGQVFTTNDNDWDILKMLAQAGAGEVMPVGGMLSCTYSAPRVAIGTITSADIAGDIDIPSSASMRARRNTVIPRVRLETHGWEEVPLSAIVIDEYVTADGGSRPKEIAFPLVQDKDLGAKLGVLKILDDRELDGLVLPTKVYMIGYLPGDCLTADIPEANLVGRDVVVRNRELDGASMGVTFTCRTETPGKHPFALGQTGAPPPTPDLSVPEYFPPVDTAANQIAIATSFPIGLTIMASRTAGDVAIALTGPALPAGVTLTRASVAKYYDAAGVSQTAAADVARFDHDPVTPFAGRGLLFEPVGTNIFPQSSNLLDSGWAKAQVTAASATRFLENTVTAAHYVSRSAAFTAGNPYVYSAIVSEIPGAPKRYPGFLLSSTVFAGNRIVVFDLAAGTFVARSGMTAGMLNLGNGRWLIWASDIATTSATTSSRLYSSNAYSSDASSHAGDTTAGIDVFHQQMEIGTLPSSQVNTTTAAATRAADSVTIDWASRGVPDGARTIRYTFDDNTTQDVAATIASGAATVPTNLNRRWIKAATALLVPGYGATASITMSDHIRRYTDGFPDVAVTGGSVSATLAAGDTRSVGYDDDDRAGGAVTYQLFASDIDAHASPAHPGRHYVGSATIPGTGEPPMSGGGATPPGGTGRLPLD